MPEKGKNSKIQ